ncbi:hypothetical protein AKJ09_07407 [Labilithrix luteola]|uniref:Uncharacterized protein n=1 Tax=Labilithrix luteola TaxID=1391654 RepID=A0A0K1Q4V7_9BACT|nr:hypothetical protein [Labilithrix luteola]AKV00744.1 hypothetical protein AKJ09_07407 [Labilithrix luteola]
MVRGKRIFFLLGGALVIDGLLVIACSSDGSSSPGETPPVTASADAGTKSDAHTSGDTGTGSNTGTDSSTPTGDGGSDCGTPATLHPPKADGGIYCPYSASDGGKNLYCPTTDQCCESAKGGSPSTCVTKGSACPTASATVWECESPLDCPGMGMQCCAHGGTKASVTVQQDTCGPYLSKFDGTRCASSCGAGELVVCEAPSDCATGTCTAVKPKGNDIGVCH